MPGAVTVTRSPGSNCVAGTKLVPLRLEYATRRPAWRPLREPVTVTAPSFARVAPRKLISVSGEALCAPGEGETVTPLGSSAFVSFVLILRLSPPTANHPAVATPTATSTAPVRLRLTGAAGVPLTRGTATGALEVSAFA